MIKYILVVLFSAVILTGSSAYYFYNESKETKVALENERNKIANCEASEEAAQIFMDTGSIDPIIDRMRSDGWIREDRPSVQQVDKYDSLRD